MSYCEGDILKLRRPDKGLVLAVRINIGNVEYFSVKRYIDSVLVASLEVPEWEFLIEDNGIFVYAMTKKTIEELVNI